jgi:hypothetical protein
MAGDTLAQRENAERRGVVDPCAVERPVRRRNRRFWRRSGGLPDFHVNDVTAGGFDSLGRRHDIHDHERRNLATAGCGLEEFQTVSHCRFKHRYLLLRSRREHLPPARRGCPRLAAFGGLLGHSRYRASRQSQKTA